MSYDQCDRVIGEYLEEGYSIPEMLTIDDFLSLHHPHHQYLQYYSSPTTNNTTAGIQTGGGGVLMNSTYCQEPSSSTNLAVDDVEVDYEVQEDADYELLVGLINIHVEKEEEEEEERPWPAADVSCWEWPRFGGTLESTIIDQAASLVPLIIHVPDHGVHHHGTEVEEEVNEDHQVVLLEDQEYCHMTPQLVFADIENTVVQSKPSMCNTEWMTVEEKNEHDRCYSVSHNNTPPPYHSQREARKITEKRLMQRATSSTTISSSNKRSKATILHNKSERKRRHKINDRMETLQKLVPNFNKTDKASMLDQVIEYVKKLQTQNDQMMNMRSEMFDNNNMMPTAVHPMMMMHYITTMQAIQQQQQQYHQQQMSMMDQMSMSMSMNPAGLVMMPTSSDVHPNMRQE